jgi:hypothetical protein
MERHDEDNSRFSGFCERLKLPSSEVEENGEDKNVSHSTYSTRSDHTASMKKE